MKKKKMKLLTIRLNEKLFNDFTKYCKNKDVTKKAFIKSCLEKELYNE